MIYKNVILMAINKPGRRGTAAEPTMREQMKVEETESESQQ